ncbi:site-specific DNA-methyltransferase [Lysobacter fragariae]
MPVLNWIGKSAVVKHHQDVPYRLLEPVPGLSCNADNSGNLIVQGDNLLALKALLPRYAGQVKCIYIDPPYNTGNEAWVYNDNVNSPEIRRWLGEVVGKEGETLDRHDRWLCMMYPRLVLLKQFLRDDGVIFVSIDDVEVNHLLTLMDEVFGRQRRLAIFTWQRKKKGSNLSKEFRKVTEYIVAYRGGTSKVELYGAPAYAEKMVPLLNRANNKSTLRFPAGKIRVGKGFGDSLVPRGVKAEDKGELAVNLVDDIHVENGVVTTPFSVEGRWRWGQDLVDEELGAGSIFVLSKDFRINVARHDQSSKFKAPSSLLVPDDGVGTNEDATDELREVFSDLESSPFDYPKPSALIRYLIRSSTSDGDLIMDSFAGSGTTGHAVLKQNFEDGGNRRFILVEMDEGIVENVTAERVKRVASGYSNAKGEMVEGLGGGFQFCKLGKSLFDSRGHIDKDVRFAELANFAWFMETGMGLPPQRASKRKADTGSPLLGVHEGRAVYLLYNGILKDRSIDGGNVLTTPLLEQLAPHQGPRVVYAARCAIGEERLRKLGIRFKHLPYDLRVKP